MIDVGTLCHKFVESDTWSIAIRVVTSNERLATFICKRAANTNANITSAKRAREDISKGPFTQAIFVAATQCNFCRAEVPTSKSHL